ncbi:MAG: hypothetical protein KDD55_08190, partial [Bdellovibrionales bacterium]|nr:hypothetical protein [Bdellovibrionales bacterium]
MILHGLILLLSLVAFFFSSHTHFWGVLERAYPSFPQWSILVDTTTNAYHVWRWDPLLVLLTGESTLSTSLILPLLHLALFSLGTAGVFRFVFGSDWIRSFIDAVLSATMLVLLFGLHPVILGTLTWIPWCILCCRPSWLLSSSTSVRSGVALFLVLRLVRTAHQLSPLALAFVFITLFALKREKPIFLSRKGFTGIFFLIALALSLYHTFEVPTPPIPDYPPFAQVVPDDGVPGIVSPRLTSYAPFQIIDRSVLRYTLAPFALLGLLLSAFFLITSQKVSARNIASTSLVLFVLLTLDTYTAESLSIISPLQAARRLLPGAFFLSLTPAFLAFSLWFLWGTLLRHRTIPTVLFFLTLWAINPF